MQLVPPERRSETIPCRHIPFKTSGEPLDALGRYSNKQETEETVGAWLRATIQRLEEERAAARQARSKQPPASGGTMRVTPLYHKEHPKCANPACPTAFHWTGGGKFFRFRPDPVPASGSDATADSPHGIHDVRHYWLCERCSHVFTLVYEEAYGVTLNVLWPELPVAEGHKEFSTA